jgi:hypothetical protein
VPAGTGHRAPGSHRDGMRAAPLPHGSQMGICRKYLAKHEKSGMAETTESMQKC